MKLLLAAPLFSTAPVRRRRWSDAMLVWAAVLMVWLEQPTLAQRFARMRDLLTDVFTSRRRVGATYQGLTKALIRHSPRLLRSLETHLRRQAASLEVPCPSPVDRPLLTVDGTKVDLPRTRANERGFEVAGKDKCRPQAWVTCLMHLASGALHAWRIGPARASERGHLRHMLKHLPENAMLVADAGFVGYDLMMCLHQRGHRFLIRVGGNVRLIRQLGYAREAGDTVYLWPHKVRRAGQTPLVLRLIVLRDRGRPVYLVTNELKHAAMSNKQVGQLYAMRWGIEVCYRGLKQTLGRRKMASHAPVQAALELRWTLVAYAALRLMTIAAIVDRGGDPQRMSVAGALVCMRRVLQRPTHRHRRGQSLYRKLGRALIDNYERKGPKRPRPHAQKKHDQPPRPPRLNKATPLQVKCAQRLSKPETKH